MTVRRAPERRFRDPLLWRHPLLMMAEVDDYAEVDRHVEAGAPCGGCGRELDWPLVQLPLGSRLSPVLVHPECATALVEGIVRDVEEIEEGEGF